MARHLSNANHCTVDRWLRFVGLIARRLQPRVSGHNGPGQPRIISSRTCDQRLISADHALHASSHRASSLRLTPTRRGLGRTNLRPPRLFARFNVLAETPAITAASSKVITRSSAIGRENWSFGIVVHPCGLQRQAGGAKSDQEDARAVRILRGQQLVFGRVGFCPLHGRAPRAALDALAGHTGRPTARTSQIGGQPLASSRTPALRPMAG